MLDFITGIQPTGDIHLGNYLGAIRPISVLQNKTKLDGMVFVADLHALTVKHDPKRLKADVESMICTLIACGLKPESLFVQSKIPEHAQLAWVLQATTARMGWLNRMTQYREKTESLGENSEGPSVGLFTYPVLQAADILCYDAETVIVGADQSQHLNLTVDIAEKFNRDFGKTLRVPKPKITDIGRVMSLTLPDKKMSKSDPNEMSRIGLFDSPDAINRKIKKATSDSGFIPETVEELEDRLPLKNLLTIYAGLEDKPIAEILPTFTGHGYGKLKPALADLIISHLGVIQCRMPGQMPMTGEDRACEIAEKVMNRVRKTIGIGF